ncbi:hypothetical protein S40293_09547, partial [Stachybotrys chartarum IBT 40293]
MLLQEEEPIHGQPSVGGTPLAICILLGQSPLYPAAVILHPRWNVSWLETNWTSHEQLVWLRDAKNSVREFFEQQYPHKEQSETARTMIGKAMRQDEASQFDQWMQSYDRYMMEEEDELGVYMRQGPVRRENLNPILWWKGHQEEYPRLSKLALDILAIPAMSVDPERTFSVTKLTSALPDTGCSGQVDRSPTKSDISCLSRQPILIATAVQEATTTTSWGRGHRTVRTNAGIYDKLVKVKEDDRKGRRLWPWGRIESYPTEDNLVNQIGWKDNAL